MYAAHTVCAGILPYTVHQKVKMSEVKGVLSLCPTPYISAVPHYKVSKTYSRVFRSHPLDIMVQDTLQSLCFYLFIIIHDV